MEYNSFYMSAREIIRHIRPLRAVAKAGFPFVQWINHKRTVVKSIDGIRYELDLNELIDSTMYYFGAFEPGTVCAFKSRVQPGHTVLDVGANVGCHTMLLSRLVGDSGTVIAFEPMPQAFAKLSRNLSLNPWARNVRLERLALSALSGQRINAAFKTSWPLFGSPKPAQRDSITTETLDTYSSKSKIERVDFIKLDVDGYERKVLRGATNTLKTFRPTLLIELSHYTLAEVGDSLRDLVSDLLARGYVIQADDAAVPFRDAEEILRAVPPDGTINAICIPK